MIGMDYVINKKFGLNTGIGFCSHDDYILGTGYFALEFGFFYKINGPTKRLAFSLSYFSICSLSTIIKPIKCILL